MSGPAVLIVLPLESAPWIATAAMTDGQERRLADWIEAHPAYSDLIERARALAVEEPAA